MLEMIQKLIQHKGHANALLLQAIKQNDDAAQDLELRKLLHHIIQANRFWLSTCLDRPFAFTEEARLPESLAAIIVLYQETHDQEWRWIKEIKEVELTRKLENQFIPGGGCSVADALMQVCLHSQGHRIQAAVRLRQLGGTPPQTDYILWLPDVPLPEWNF